MENLVTRLAARLNEKDFANARADNTRRILKSIEVIVVLK